MSFGKHVALLAIIGLVFVTSGGCETETKTKTTSGTSKKETKKDDHDDHPAHGKNGGHIFEAENGEVHVHLEVVIEANDKQVRLISVDHDNNPMPIAATEAKVNFEGGKKPQLFTFKPQDAKDGKATEFVCDDAASLIAFNTGCKIEMTVSDKPLVFNFKPSDH